MTTPSKSIISQVMSELGKRGTGSSKVRGDSAYYKRIVAIREAKRKLVAKGKNKDQIQTKSKGILKGQATASPIKSV